MDVSSVAGGTPALLFIKTRQAEFLNRVRGASFLNKIGNDLADYRSTFESITRKTCGDDDVFTFRMQINDKIFVGRESIQTDLSF